MALLDFFKRPQKLSTVLPNIPFNGQVAIQQGIITWQGGDNISFVNDGYSANDIVYSIVKLIADKAKLAPTLRVEGSGATSDFEIKSFLAAIPSLFNTAEGREIMAVYAEKLANRAVEAADIRARLIEENNGKFYIKEYQKALKDAGLTQVFTPEDLQILSGKKAPQGGVNLSSPAAQQAYEKYKPR